MHLKSSVISLDIGEKRIGVAIVKPESSIPRPLTVLSNNFQFNSELTKLIEENRCDRLVVGLPRGLDGQETPQTKYVREFTKKLDIKVPVHFQDEAGTSVKATEILDSTRKGYNKGDIDAMAACVILEDHIANLANGEVDAQEKI